MQPDKKSGDSNFEEDVFTTSAIVTYKIDLHPLKLLMLSIACGTPSQKNDISTKIEKYSTKKYREKDNNSYDAIEKLIKNLL